MGHTVRCVSGVPSVTVLLSVTSVDHPLSGSGVVGGLTRIRRSVGVVLRVTPLLGRIRKIGWVWGLLKKGSVVMYLVSLLNSIFLGRVILQVKKKTPIKHYVVVFWF